MQQPRHLIHLLRPKYLKYSTILMMGILLGACQTLPVATAPNTHNTTDGAMRFDITGKIGITTKTHEGVQAGSAFYTWGQDDKRFGVELTGALGMGATTITFDGQTATLTSERTGVITADSPESLLFRATGWQAPISQLPFWVLGRTSPDDDTPTYQDGRLTHSTHGDWQANFEYPKHAIYPSRLSIHHVDGHKVVMTITHLQ